MKKKPFLPILCCNLFLMLTFLFFSPLEVIARNAGEFFFPLSNIWWFQLLVCLAGSLLLTLLMLLLPARAGLTVAAAILGLGLAAYVQILFLNGLIPSMTGKAIDISSSDQTLNLVIWIGITLLTVLLVFLFSKKFRKNTEFALCAVAGALILMQLAGFVSAALTMDTEVTEKRQNHVLSAQGQFELGSDANVVVFVMDTADGAWAREMLDRWPDLKDTLSGWTWYPNATSRYNRTYPSLTYMLTGQACHFDKPVPTYVDEAFTKGSAFLKNLADAGVDTRILTPDPDLISDLADPYIANAVDYDYSDFGNLYLPRLEKVLLRIAIYKSAPYLLKNYGLYDMNYVNTASFKIHNDPETKYGNYDYEFHAKLKANGLTVSDTDTKAFRFYHTAGTHIGVFWGEDLVPDPNRVGTEDYPAALRGCFRNVEEYIARLKDLGLYDSATIIVTADHGSNFGVPYGQPLERTTSATPIMMVKYANSDLSQPLREDKAPVSQDELFATVEQALSAASSGLGNGKTFKDFTEGEARERFYDFVAYREHLAGEIAVREYLIDGDAKDIANYHLTGNWWDVLYSVQPISDEPFP